MNGIKSADKAIAEPAGRLVEAAGEFARLGVAWGNTASRDNPPLLASGHALVCIRDAWPAALDLASAMIAGRASGSERGDSKTLGDVSVGADGQYAHQGLRGFAAWLQKESHLIGCWAWKPLVDAKGIVKALGVRGREIGVLMRKQAEWRLQRPTATPEAALAFLRSEVNQES